MNYECAVCGSIQEGYHAEWCQGASESLVARIASLKLEITNMNIEYGNRLSEYKTVIEARLEQVEEKVIESVEKHFDIILKQLKEQSKQECRADD